VPGGSVIGITGPNGAGKTTLFNVILGLLEQDQGTVMLNGVSIDRLHPWQRARLGIGCLWQDGRIFRHLSVLDNLLVAGPDVSNWSALDFVLRRKRQRIVEESKLQLAEQALQRIGLAGMEQMLAVNLSHGQQRLLALGRLLVNAPRILLLDEPVEGLDSSFTARILQLLKELRSEGKGILLIEHDPFVIESVVDVVYVMKEGSLTLHVSSRSSPPGEEYRFPNGNGC
jgi:ABC-type branched-subunit amino acid transport system ATPase component